MKNLKFLVVFLVVVLSLCLAFVACNGDETTASESTNPSGSSSQAPAATSSVPSNTTEAPANTTEKPAETTTDPIVIPPIEPTNAAEEYMYAEERDYLLQHMAITVGDHTDTNSVKHKNSIYFTIKSEGGNFVNDADGKPGLSHTIFDRLYIVDHGTATSPAENPECTLYERAFYETANWWEIWVAPEGWTPEPGHRYEFYLFITGDEETTTYSTSLYFWNMDEENWWTAPSPIVSSYGNIEEMVPNFHDRSELPYHDKFLFGDEETAPNCLHFTFGSQNQFGDKSAGTDDTGAEITDYGVSHTHISKLYINGKEYEVENYRTKEWYQLYFEIVDMPEFVSGETYEFVIVVEADDQTGELCKNPNGYFIFYEYVAP